MKIKFERGYDSFCDNHGTKYWKLIFIDLKKNILNYIIHFDNDLKTNKKYHCFVDYYGYVGLVYFNTDNFKEAFKWMKCRLKTFINN